MTSAEIYNLLLAVHEKQGKLDEHMEALDGDIGALAASVRKLDISLRGNGEAGVLTRVSMLEDQYEKLVPATTIERLEARFSEHCRADASRATRSGHRLHFWATIAAASIAACASVAAVVL